MKFTRWGIYIVFFFSSLNLCTLIYISDDTISKWDCVRKYFVTCRSRWAFKKAGGEGGGGGGESSPSPSPAVA